MADEGAGPGRGGFARHGGGPGHPGRTPDDGAQPGQRHGDVADGQERTVALAQEKPGLFTARIASRELGLHTLRSGELIAFASVGPANPRELDDVFSDTARLRPIAEATGGSVRRVAAEAGGVTVPRIQSVRSGTRFAGADWIGIRPSDNAVVRGVSVFPIALGFLGLALLLGATLIAWMAEGRLGRRVQA